MATETTVACRDVTSQIDSHQRSLLAVRAPTHRQDGVLEREMIFLVAFDRELFGSEIQHVKH